MFSPGSGMPISGMTGYILSYYPMKLQERSRAYED